MPTVSRVSATYPLLAVTLTIAAILGLAAWLLVHAAGNDRILFDLQDAAQQCQDMHAEAKAIDGRIVCIRSR
jgi:hypothetical protein